MKNVIKVGVIGYGYWGPNLVRNLTDIPDCSLLVVADLNQRRLQHLHGCYPHITVTQDYRNLFEMGLDAVVIATPPATHFPLASESLLHGLHVLVEKPLALASRHAQALIDLSQRGNRVLMVGHTFIYNPAVCALKRMIQSGELGQVHYIDTARLSLGLFQRDLNVLWDLAPHDISIVMDLLTAQPMKVSARGTACVQKDVEDVAYMSLEFPDGVLAHVHVSWLDPCKVRRITIVGSKKMVVYDDVETLEKVRVYDKGVECPPYTDNYSDFQFSYRYGDITIPYIKFTEPLRLECQHFLECISEGTQPQTDGQAGLDVVRVIEAAQRSLRNSGHQEEICDGVRMRNGEQGVGAPATTVMLPAAA
jgi:predicted dehydrogenase